MATSTNPTPAAMAFFARKPHSLRDLDGHTSASRYTIAERRELTPAEYDAFTSDFYAAHDWLKGKGGYNATGAVAAIAVSAPGRQTLLVDPEGNDYARYVAREPSATAQDAAERSKPADDNARATLDALLQAIAEKHTGKAALEAAFNAGLEAGLDLASK